MYPSPDNEENDRACVPCFFQIAQLISLSVGKIFKSALGSDYPQNAERLRKGQIYERVSYPNSSRADLRVDPDGLDERAYGKCLLERHTDGEKPEQARVGHLGEKTFEQGAQGSPGTGETLMHLNSVKG